MVALLDCWLAGASDGLCSVVLRGARSALELQFAEEF